MKKLQQLLEQRQHRYHPHLQQQHQQEHLHLHHHHRTDLEYKLIRLKTAIEINLENNRQSRII